MVEYDNVCFEYLLSNVTSKTADILKQFYLSCLFTNLIFILEFDSKFHRNKTTRSTVCY